MLLLIFTSGDERYGLDISRVVEVAPLAALRPVPHAPEGMLGLLNYRGAIVPVVDLSLVLNGTASPARLSTRIVLVNVGGDAAAPRLLGFAAEGVTETVACRAEDLREPGVAVARAPYLGRIMLDQHAMIQQLDPTTVLPEALREALFAMAAGDGRPPAANQDR